MEEQKIIDILVERGFNPKNASLVAKDLLNISPDLSGKVGSWLSNENNQEDANAEGYSVRYFQNSFGMSYPAALLTIDWLKKDPENALKSICKGLR